MGESILQGELVLCIDFDGTITTEPDMGHELVLRENCKRVLTRMHEDGVKLILWTCRAGSSLNQAMDFLEENELLSVFDAVNDQLHEVKEKYWPDVARKAGADFYFDDKNAMTEEVNWSKFEEFIYGKVVKSSEC